MFAPKKDDGRAAARARCRIFTRRTRAGRRWTGRAIQSLLAVATLTALGVTAGAASASAATAKAAGPPITGVAWHQLSLINGWVSGPSQSLGEGIPAWAVRNGVVYLDGSVVQTSGTNSEFAVLPPAARPSHFLYMPVEVQGQGTHGWITVYPSGAMYVTGVPSNSAQGWTGLAGISYPAQAMAMSTLPLENGWQSSDSQWTTGDPSYSVSNGMVYLSGSLNQPTGDDQVFALLPPAARPAHPMYLSVYTFGGAIGELEIDTNGDMLAYEGGAQLYTSLAGVSFPVASAATSQLTLINGWHSAQPLYGTGDPSYSVKNGVVHLSGSLVQPPAPGGTQDFAVLPPAARPKYDLYIPTEVSPPDSFAAAGDIVISPDGRMFS
ncbi:MAG: hypothetical protein ACTHPS_09845, partial [Streptosporangiaceae bacterium]